MAKLPFEKRDAKLLVKKEASTDPAYGCVPSERKTGDLLDLGIITVNKPSGPTSHQVSAYVQDILGIDKAGHTGTLDPKVTGLLPVALGRGTRIVQSLLTAGKEYVCLMKLHTEVPKTTIKSALKEYQGVIKQLPPVKSAVKRQWREREIYYVKFMEMEGREVLFRIGCEAGTYIRKYCTDFGERIGVGAHMAQLVRSKAGPFKDDAMVTLQDLRDAFHYWKEGNDKMLRHYVKPIEDGVAHLKKVYVLDTTISTLCHGRDLAIPGLAKLDSDIEKGDMIAILSLKGELVALGEAKMDSELVMRNERGICVRTNKVFMLPGVYPKEIKNPE